MGRRINRFVSTMNESSDAMLDMADMGNERAHKWGKIVLEEARRTQREQADLTRIWLEAPTDAIGLTKAAIETWTRRQRRRFELGRQAISEMAGLGSETRDTFQRVVEANREAMQVGVEAGRNAANQAGREARETVSEVAREVSERAEDVADVAEKASRNARRRNGG
ncbi:MAG: hypothetical protein E6I03_10735 [Chloroflexi bacterium]|nr:MAG: hypothetical protein E6I03_10735 [Chloroflexota bacterium]